MRAPTALAITGVLTMVLAKRLYPTHETYVAKVKASAAAAVKAGFLLRDEARVIDHEADSAPVPT